MNTKTYLNPNILDEGNHMMIIDDSEYQKTHDECDLIVRCNNCGQPTKYGNTRMISGFVGCDNKFIHNGVEKECFFDDLCPRVLDYQKNNYEAYRTGKLYRFRDGVE